LPVTANFRRNMWTGGQAGVKRPFSALLCVALLL